MAYLDKTGLTYFWGKISSTFAKKSEIPPIPSSLPANGGNADTVDGWHFEVIGDGSAPATVNTISFDYTEG